MGVWVGSNAGVNAFEKRKLLPVPEIGLANQ
jgi:hypothetical protein